MKVIFIRLRKKDEYIYHALKRRAKRLDRSINAEAVRLIRKELHL